MNRRHLGYILVGLLLGTPAIWAALDQVRKAESARLLRAIATAHERTGYYGTASLRRSKVEWTVWIRHDAESGRTAYRWGWFHRFTSNSPSSRTPDPAAWCLDAGLVVENYGLSEGSRDRYLGRDVRTFTLEPRHAGRPTVQLVVDAATLLALKVTTFDRNGELHRVRTFQEVEIGPQKVPARRDQRKSRWLGTPVAPDKLHETAGFHGLRPDYLPAGFRCVERRVSGRTTPAIRLLYTDGITAFELRQSRVGTPAQIETALLKRMSPKAARRMLEWIASKRLAALARSDGAGEVVVRRSRSRRHRKFELRVGDLEVKLTSRKDLGEEEPLRVLRSLRAR